MENIQLDYDYLFLNPLNFVQLNVALYKVFIITLND